MDCGFEHETEETRSVSGRFTENFLLKNPRRMSNPWHKNTKENKVQQETGTSYDLDRELS